MANATENSVLWTNVMHSLMPASTFCIRILQLNQPTANEKVGRGSLKRLPRPLFMNSTNSNSSTKSPPLCLKPLPPIPSLPPPENAAKLLLDETITKPLEIVAGLIHQGTKVVLGGSSKAGKTWLLLDLALSVTTGTKFLRWETKKGRVLYLNFEIPGPFIKDRVQALVKRRQLDPPTDLVFWNLRGKAADFGVLVQQVIKQAEQENYVLIIIDPIYKLMAGKSENMAGGVGALCHQLERLAERTGAAVVYAHHFTKGAQGKKKPIDRLSGSGVFGRDADSIILFTDHTEPNCFTVDLVLRNLAPQESFVVEWNFPVMVERDDLEPEGENEQGNERARAMLSLLLTRPMTTGEWEVESKVCGISRATFFRMKAELMSSRHIVQNPNDKTWSVAAAVIETSDTHETVETNDTSETPEAEDEEADSIRLLPLVAGNE